MMSRKGLVTVVAGVAIAALLASGCGGVISPDSPKGGVPSVSAWNVAEAETALEPYVGHPSEFPVNDPLPKRPRAGTRFAFLQCSTPLCALLARTAAQAAAHLGVKLTVTKAGSSAQALQQAMSSIISQKPAAVLIPAVDPAQYRDQMKQLKALRIPVIAQGVVNGDQFGIEGQIGGQRAQRLSGKLLADWTVHRNGAKPSVFYSIPELSFSTFVQDGFKTEMKKLCPACKVRYVTVPIATVGNRAPDQIAGDLRAHPKTKTAVFGALEMAHGLPAAMQSAGISVDTVGLAPDPRVLGYIKDGKMTAGLAYDSATSTWVQVDVAARLVTGQRLTEAEVKDRPVLQFLEQRDITFDPAEGYNGYGDVAKRFDVLWGTATKR